jgi:hypothetical protein
MLSRRSFLVSAGAGAAAGALSSSVFANHHIKIPLGIQLWTVKSEAEKDLEGTLRKLYALGFREIEFAGYYGKPAAEVGSLLKSIGLSPVSTHAGADLIASSGEQVIADAKTLGLKYIICSSPMSDAAGETRLGEEDGRARRGRLEAQRRPLQQIRQAGESRRHAVRLSPTITSSSKSSTARPASTPCLPPPMRTS